MNQTWEKYYTFIMKWWRTTSRIGKKNCLRGNLTSAPSFHFRSMYEKKNQGSIWSVLLIETFFIFQSTFLTRLIKLMLWCIPLAKEEIVTCDMEMCSTILNCDITEEDYSTTTHHCNARFISTWGNHAVRTRKGSNSAKEDYSCTVN